MPYTLLYVAYWFMILPVWTIPVEIFHIRAKLGSRIPFWSVVGRVSLAILVTHLAIAAVVLFPLLMFGFVVPAKSLWFIGLSPWDHASAKAALCGAAFLFVVSHFALRIEQKALNVLLRKIGLEDDIAPAVTLARRWSAVGRWGVVFLQIIFG